MVVIYGYNFSFKMQFLRVSRQIIENFSMRGHSFLWLLVNVYRSALIPRKLPCPKKCLVRRLKPLLYLLRDQSRNQPSRIIDTPESFRISSFDSVQNTFKNKCVGVHFQCVAGLHLQRLLRNKQLLRYIFKTPTLRTPFSLKKYGAY